jgi:hypothetical protein
MLASNHSIVLEFPNPGFLHTAIGLFNANPSSRRSASFFNRSPLAIVQKICEHIPKNTTDSESLQTNLFLSEKILKLYCYQRSILSGGKNVVLVVNAIHKPFLCLFYKKKVAKEIRVDIGN